MALGIRIEYGGSASVVLAARLGADTQSRVLLLEAGPNFTRGAWDGNVNHFANN